MTIEAVSERKKYVDYFTDYETVRKSLFLGLPLGLLENLRNEFPVIWDFYKRLKNLDWEETELPVKSCKQEFLVLDPEITDLMRKTLAFQYEGDTSASQIGKLMYPFVTNTELFCYITELTKNECYTPDHDVLTIDGWMPIAEVYEGLLVAQWDPTTKDITFVKNQATIHKHYKGTLYHYESVCNRVDQLVTENHRMPVVDNDKNWVGWRYADGNLNDGSGNCSPVYKYNRNFPLAHTFVHGENVTVKQVPYDGKVHCLTVPSGYFMVRRNGKVSVGGNCLHSLAYKFIVENCFDNPLEFLDYVKSLESSFRRLSAVQRVFEEIYQLGLEYQIGNVADENVIRKALLKFWATLYCLERIQFIASFAITFGLAENNYFVPIGKLVQKIATEEFQIHVQADKAILKNELSIPETFALFLEIAPEISEIIHEVTMSEINWLSEELFKDKKVIAGIYHEKIKKAVIYASQEVYQFFGIESPFEHLSENPLPSLDEWLVIDNNQASPQEEATGNYLLGGFVDDRDSVNIFKKYPLITSPASLERFAL